MEAEEVLLSLRLELELPVQLALRLVRGPVLPLALDAAVALDEALDEALAAALSQASQLTAADASTEEGRRRREGIRPPRGDLQRPQMLGEAQRIIVVVCRDGESAVIANTCFEEWGEGFLEVIVEGSPTKVFESGLYSVQRGIGEGVDVVEGGA